MQCYRFYHQKFGEEEGGKQIVVVVKPSEKGHGTESCIPESGLLTLAYELEGLAHQKSDGWQVDSMWPM